ncbi:MAG: site-specific integrase [Anaerolineae bacterium]|nr:site-specific integrase [Anaerolineae bacterium]
MNLYDAALWHDEIIRGAVSEKTREWYFRISGTGNTSGALSILMRYFGQERRVAGITPLELARWRMWLLSAPINRRKPGQTLAPASSNTYLRSVRSFFGRLHRYDKLEDNPAADLKLIPLPDPSPASFTVEELQLLAEAAAAHPTEILAIRDTAIVLSLAETGCRAHGLTTMPTEHLDMQRWRAIVWEKSRGGRRSRPVFWSSEIGRNALAAWMEIRPHQAATVFYAVCCHHPYMYDANCAMCNQHWGQELTPDGLGQLIRRLCRRTGIPGRGPHAIRHAVGKELVKSGVSLAAVSQILGHRDPAITALFYGRLESDELAAVHGNHVWIE